MNLAARVRYAAGTFSAEEGEANNGLVHLLHEAADTLDRLARTPITSKVEALAERELVLARLAWLNEYIADPNPPQTAEPTAVETVDGPVGEVGRPPAQYVGKGGLQPFEIIDAFGLDFFEGNALKYLLRWRKKNGLEDLRKAAHYIDEVIARAGE